MFRNGFWLVLVLLGLLDQGFACSCASRPQACQHLLSAAAFVGQVIETKAVQHQREGIGLTRGYSMRFSVEETLRGDLGPEITIETGAGGGDCGTPLQPGSRFLIFANKAANGEFWTGLCSGNRELNGNPQNQQFLEELRAAVKTGKSSIAGTVFEEGQESGAPADLRRAMQGVVVRAESESFKALATTDKAGSFRFSELPNGKYEVVAHLPPGLDYDHRYERWYQADLSSGSCASINFAARPSTGIRGQINSSLKDQAVLFEVFAEAAPGQEQDIGERSAVSDDNGRFDLWPMQPGDYLLRVQFKTLGKTLVMFPPLYFPGVNDKAAAVPVHVEKGARKEIAFSSLGAAVPRKVQFSVVNADALKPQILAVQLEDLSHPGMVTAEVNYALDKNGGGEIFVLSGEAYHLHGSSVPARSEIWCSEPVEIAEGTGPLAVRFVMHKAITSCDIRKMDAEKSQKRAATAY